MKSRADIEFIGVFTDLHDHLLTREINPEYTRLGNEASPAFQREINSNTIDFQLAPPEIHLRNAAERAIRTFKDHFVAGLCSTDPDFTM